MVKLLGLVYVYVQAKNFSSFSRPHNLSYRGLVTFESLRRSKGPSLEQNSQHKYKTMVAEVSCEGGGSHGSHTHLCFWPRNVDNCLALSSVGWLN